MNYPVNLVLAENLIQQCLVPYVALVKSNVFARYFLHALDCLGRRVGQIVHHNHVVAFVKQFHICVRTDVSGTTRNKNSHFVFLLIY